MEITQDLHYQGRASYRGREQLLELDGERARPLQISDTRAIGAILRRLHDLRAASHQRGKVGMAIRAVEADRGDTVVGPSIENEREGTELQDSHPRVAEARHDSASRGEPLDRAA